MSDKNIYQKIKYFFACFNNDRGLNLDKTKDCVDRNTGGLVYSLHEVTHSSGNIHGEICIFERSNEKKSFLES